MGLVLRIVVGLLVVYAVTLALSWLFQGRLIHLPDTPGRDLRGTPGDVGLSFEAVNLRVSDRVQLHGWFVPADDARGVLLFFHGNAGNISDRLDSIELFNELGMSVFIIDYRGYGQSTGHPTEAGLYADAQAAWDYLTETRGVDAAGIVIFGRSLGAAVAAHLAARERPGALILESGFTSVADMAAEHYGLVAKAFPLWYRYDTLAAVRKVDVPVLVVHSRDDEIVPFHHGERIFDAATEPKSFVALSGDHNTGFLVSRDRYMDGLRSFLRDNFVKSAGRIR